MLDSLSLPDSRLLRDSSKEQFIKFHLKPETTAMLSLQQLTEILTINVKEIVPIFQMPAWVVGVYNWRGEILWLVDFGYLVGLVPCYQQIPTSTQTVIVLQPDAETTGNSNQLGLIVNQVQNIEWCHQDWIQSSLFFKVTPQLLPFLCGYCLKPNGETLAVIDGKTLVSKLQKLQKPDFSSFEI